MDLHRLWCLIKHSVFKGLVLVIEVVKSQKYSVFWQPTNHGGLAGRSSFVRSPFHTYYMYIHVHARKLMPFVHHTSCEREKTLNSSRRTQCMHLAWSEPESTLVGCVRALFNCLVRWFGLCRHVVVLLMLHFATAFFVVSTFQLLSFEKVETPPLPRTPVITTISMRVCAATLVAAVAAVPSVAAVVGEQPSFLFILGDDIGPYVLPVVLSLIHI